MDHDDYYYRDIVDGISDVDSVSSDEDNVDGDADCRRLFEHGKHLSELDKQALLGSRMFESFNDDSNQSFEREMENEARNHVNGLHVNHVQSSNETNSTELVKSCPKIDANIVSIASTSRTKEQENDDLFYDPDEDECNETWLESHRTQCSSAPRHAWDSERQAKLDQSGRLKKPQSDATLNCPCCLSVLCLDCQRHDTYKTQYRAMFVLNCRVEHSKKLIYRNKEEARQQYRRSKKYRQSGATSNNNNNNTDKEIDPSSTNQANDVYFPVHCCQCNTQVALYDTDEVYHFFSVIASH